MLCRPRSRRRRGTTLVEAALVYPTVFLLMLGGIVLGLGVFRAQQMALLAREGARWASVRGAQYASDTGNAAATSDDIINYVKGKAVGLNTSSPPMTITPSWNTSNALTRTSGSSTIKNTVSVTVSYVWVPEAYFGGVTLSSTSVMTMSY